MNRVQIIGLPGAGKTEGITAYLTRCNPPHTIHLDIRVVKGRDRERRFVDRIWGVWRCGCNVIAESACGVQIPSYTILLQPPIDTVIEHLRKRGEAIDPDYLSLLSSIMLPADRTIRSAMELPIVLKYILR